MNPNDLATRYHLLNSSFKKTMIYHIGIDAGFFTEYTYMLHAMLYCLQHKIQFKLYSDDANFGWEKGWEDCFAPFCEQVHEPFHHTYNTHRLPSWQALMKDKKLPKTKLLKWKLKVTCKNIIGKALAFFTYGKPVRLNFQVTFNPNQHFHIPELGIDGDYLHTFQKLTEITWKLNDTTAQECLQFAASLQLPPQYAGCQIRGGDKITETNLLPPGHTLVHPLQPRRKRICQQRFHADHQRAETETNGTFPFLDTDIDGRLRLYRKHHYRPQPVPIEEILSGHQSGRLSAQGLSASIRPSHTGTRTSGHRIYARKLKVIVT